MRETREFPAETTSAPRPAASSEGAAGLLHRGRAGMLARLAVFLIVTAGVVLLLVRNRDDQEVRSCRERMEHALGEFESALRRGDTLGALPLPVRPDTPRDHFHFNSLYSTGPSPTLTCCCAEPHHLYLRAGGRHLITFDRIRGAYSMEWLTEDEFQARLASLNFRLLRR